MSIYLRGVKKGADIYGIWYDKPKSLHLNLNNLSSRDALLERATESLGDVLYNKPAWFPTGNTTFYTNGTVPFVKSNTPPYLQLRFTPNQLKPVAITFEFATWELSTSAGLQWRANIYPSTPASDYTQLANLAWAHKNGDPNLSSTAGPNNGIYNYSANPTTLETKLLGRVSVQRSSNVIKVYLNPILKANNIGNDFRIGCVSFRYWSLANGTTETYSNQIGLRNIYIDYV